MWNSSHDQHFTTILCELHNLDLDRKENLTNCVDEKRHILGKDWSTGSWKAQNLPDGTYSFFVTVKDDSGNQADITLKFQVDGTPPKLEFLEKIPDITSKVINVRFKCNESCKIFYKFNDIQKFYETWRVGFYEADIYFWLTLGRYANEWYN